MEQKTCCYFVIYFIYLKFLTFFSFTVGDVVWVTTPATQINKGVPKYH